MSFLFPTANAAERALLAALGGGKLERITVRRMTAAELADGLAAYAPAVMELLDDAGKTVAVPRPGRVLDLDGEESREAWKNVRRALEETALRREQALFAKLPISESARRKVAAQRVGATPLVRVTHFAAPPGERFAAQLSAAGWWKRLTLSGVAHALGFFAGLVAWTFIGRAALTGRWDPGWFWGWAILLALLIPLEAAASWLQGWLAVAFGGHLKQRLLAGSLEIDADRIRHQGVGQLLGRVLESEALEGLAITGGGASLLSLIELAAAALVISLGAARWINLTLFAAWILLLAAVGVRYARQRRQWMLERNRLTHGLVEKMSGHRTRIAQQPPELWHEGEDRELAEYLRVSASMDRTHAWLTAVGPRGWLALGVASVGLEFARGSAAVPMESIAVAIAGVMLGYQALRRFVFGVGQFAGAWQAWALVRELFDAARPTAAEASEEAVSASGKVLEVRDLRYAFPGRERPVVAGCSLEIREGDRILLEGGSGGGKSTFGALLAGLRKPAGGLLLAGGLDPATVGMQGWRKRVATAPQYHENHIMAASLLFNLSLGRGWPPPQEAVREAREVCLELGLGPLLERMPAGMMEMVGDSGWQLSQGERSRVFLARAILQGAALVILDESFAALDPETLDRCLRCVLKRAPSLLVIAHP